MKVTSLDNPVKVDWFFEQGLRLDPAPYLSGALEARKRLETLPDTQPLASLTAGHSGGIFNGPMFRRVYLNDPEYGVPFLGSKDMMVSDLTRLPRLRKSDAESRSLSYLRLKPGMTLISCSGFYAGRRSYVRPDMATIWSSQDVLKVESDPDKIRAGYLYAFLASPFGEAFVKASVYGSAVKHIEPHHLADLPVPRFGGDLEQKIHDLVEESAHLRAAFQAGLNAATEDFFRSVGLPDLIDYRWDAQEPDLGFVVNGVSASTLRALNFSPRAQLLIQKLRSVEHCTLGQICENGVLSRGIRFKRIDTDEEHGVPLIGQRQAFWSRPEGRLISREALPAEAFANDETVIMAAQGTLGEREVYCRPIMVTGAWLENAYSEHFLRIESGDVQMPGAYIFAFLRSEVAFRIFRSLSTGGKQQDIHDWLRRQVPIPIASADDRERIAETVRRAHRDRDRADVLEDEALTLLTQAIKGAEA